MNTYRFQVIIERDEDGYYVAEVPTLQGCYTQGKTLEETIENIHDVISLCVEELREEGKEIQTEFPEVIGIKTLEITM